MTNENFKKTLKFVLQREGGYVNDPADLGGETNKGITYRTYNAYRKGKGLKPQSVKYITDVEVEDIYYNDYYKASGADKISDPRLSAYVFDTAVNMGVSRAKTFLSQSNGDTEKFEQLRRAKYDEFVLAKPSQKKYLQGWNNRVTELKNFSDKSFSQDTFKEESNRLFKLSVEKNVLDIDTRTPSQKFNDEIREKVYGMRNERNRRILGKNYPSNYGKSGDGHCLVGSHLTATAKAWFCLSASARRRWVTINGAHVFIED